MKLFFDFFPVILFFVAYKAQGIYIATVVAIGASAAQVGWTRYRHGRVERMHLITLGLLVFFGGMTLALRDPTFVMWKPTIVNWCFGLVFLVTQFVGEKPLVQRMMGQTVDVPEPIWRRLNLAWAAFFGLSGVVNLYVVYVGSGFYSAKQALIAASGQSEIDLARCADLFTGDVLTLCNAAQLSESAWVDFKLFGLLGMTLAFVIAQAIYLSRHLRDPLEGAAASKTDSPTPP
jgi:intracellular septation protein